ncbi:hypothetical protein [Nonomuraea basaltis]|uniref:hypothetical protein n=1 Tax=Nonomuraea basaltis TaxID=2495887 RepID=UPI00110C571B|nr:hypothetical protein [Nonomuraea basaltis]TMR92152.1 hypothetical protein EJK15_46175 [Nonomuraea basaltis]
MKRRVRLLLATATGAAVLLGGTGLTATGAYASHQALTMADDFTGDASASASIPLESDVEGTVTLKLNEPAKVTSVTGSIEPPGKAAKTVTFDFRTGDTATTQALTGKWPITKDDPAGDWKLSVVVARDTGTNTTPFVVKVSGKQGISGGNVTPDPVQLVTGKDVLVSVEASVKDAATVSAKLVSDAGGEFYDLGDLAKESDGYYRGSTYFADDTTPGDWTLEVHATKNGQTLKGVASFTVVAPAGGASKKAKSRVTIAAPNKVRKSKTFKVYGKVYRGSKAYKGKTVEVYFKAKGTKTYKLMGFAKATSTGKYSKSFKARKDGYFRVKVPGTSKTRSSLSPQEFVDVK